MQARTAAVRIGVAVNKLAAKALAGADVTAAELAAAPDATARAVARDEQVAAVVHRVIADRAGVSGSLAVRVGEVPLRRRAA
jgi:hypothetical protein